MRIFRYEDIRLISSDLDPIEDILVLITTLRSKGYTEDLLRDVHGFSSLIEIKRTSKLIGLHVENAIGLATQAFEGSSETSYLPLYYSTLNLSKVLLLLLGKRAELENNRWHGAKYNESDMSRDFLKERIEIKNGGTIPLLYRTVLNGIIPRKGLNIPLKDIYSQISSVAAEYQTITGDKGNMFCFSAYFVQDDLNGHFIRIDILDRDFRENPPVSRFLRAFSRIKLVNNPGSEPHYESFRIKGPFPSVKRQLLLSVRRSLFSDDYFGRGFIEWVSYMPINGKKHVFNEELSIMLAYFHLSNVVRYNPEHLYKLRDSRYWSIMLALRKHGYLKFIKLMWGNFNRFSFDVV